MPFRAPIALRRPQALAALSLIASAAIATATTDETAMPDTDAILAERVEIWRGLGMSEDLLTQIGAGAAVFRETCAVCHGDLGEGGAGYATPIIETRALDKFRTGHRLFLYNRDMMPFNEPGSLSPDTVWQVTAFLMAMNGWLDGLDAPLGAENARDVEIAP
jgi:S-disulfanyl-L-cysteine oxidoreductase SoxD